MATLTETAYYTRKIIKYGATFIGLLIILRILGGAVWYYWRKFHPPPPPPPTVAFGKLPELKFPVSSPSASLFYSLETIEGVPPKTEKVGKVYFIPRPVSNLLSLERAKAQVAKIGFSGEPLALSQTLYQWTDPETSLWIIKMDIVSGSFILTYDFLKDQSSIAEKKFPSQEAIVGEAQNFLSRLNLFFPDLKNGKKRVSFLKLVVDQLEPATSLSTADFVRVDLFRQDLDNFSLFTPLPSEGIISFLFSGSSNPKKRIAQVNYSYFPIDLENFATYPLKSSQEAWEELQMGKGYIASLGTNPGNQIIIRRIFLAYYDLFEYQPFLQPIFVFEGDKGFLAYIPAIASEWTD